MRRFITSFRMRTVAALLLLPTLVIGCSTTRAFERTTGETPIKMTLDEMRAVNRSRLQKVSLGMTRQDVLAVMGTDTFYQRVPYKVVSNPFRIESAKGPNGKRYEILLYYTDQRQGDDALTDDELTPLVFEEGKLIGWGWLFVDDATDKLRIEVR